MAETKKEGEGARDPSRIPGELGEILGAAARVNTVFGDPVTQGELTVVPVARARWGLGGGRAFARPTRVSAGRAWAAAAACASIRSGSSSFAATTPSSARSPRETRWGLLLGAAALGFLIGRL